MFEATRSRRGGLALLIVVLCACTAAPAWGDIPTGYGAQALDPSGAGLTGARAGEGVVNAGDVDADGRDDVLVAAPSAVISGTVTGRVYMYSGATGQPLWDAAAPFPQAQSEGAATQFGAGIARLGDIGQCTFGGSSCTFDPALDGAAELLVSAPGTDTGGVTGPDQGVVYVLDGETGRILKDVRLSAGGRPFFGSAGFGKAVASLAGQPPCGGFGGIGGCDVPAGSDVAVGDMDGGGKADFVVGAPDYTEAGDGEYAGCPVGDPCAGVGRVYVVLGEQISGSSQTPLGIDGDNASVIQFPGQAGGGEPPRFGSALTAAGDLGRCPEGDPQGGPACLGQPVLPLTNAPDGKPDFVASAPGADVGATPDAGAAFAVDAAGVRAMVEIASPTPQTGAGFGSFAQSFLAPGRLGDDQTPDLVLGAPGEDTGVAHLINGDVLGTSRVIRTFTDPSPIAGGRFGSSLAGLGDVSGDGIGEVALGAAGGAREGSVNIVSACARDVVQTIRDPDPQTGGGFGYAVAPLGDVNRDGMLDLAVGTPGFNAGAGADRGRAYLLTSNGVSAPAAAGCAGGTGTGGGGATGGGSGGGTQAKTPGTGSVVVARVLRRLVLKASRKRVRKYGRFRLSGRLTASANRTVCQSGQKVALQRRKAKGGRFQTFELAYTRKSGRFTVRTIAERTFVYRARVAQTARCMGAVSRTAKVSLARARLSR